MPADGSVVNEEKLWNTDDVILAAELGKALFEQNKVLFETLEKARVDSSEKQLELELMNQQLSELRDLVQKKALLLEEADTHILELDRVNHRLVQECATAKKQIKRLTAYTLYLEQQVSGLEDRAKTCICGKLSNPRPWSTDPVRGSDRWTLPSGRSSPASPYDYSFAPRTNRPSTVKDDFIDDELSDQPQLGSCMLLPESNEPCSIRACGLLRGTTTNLFRCLSYPVIFRPDLMRHASVNQVAMTDVQPVPLLLKPADQYATHDVIITGSTTMPDSVCIQSCDAQAVREPCDWSSVDSSVDLKSLKDLLDDALFIKRLEAIYHIKLRSQIPNDYQPSYKQLFQDAFQLIRSARTPVSRGAT